MRDTGDVFCCGGLLVVDVDCGYKVAAGEDDEEDVLTTDCAETP